MFRERNNTVSRTIAARQVLRQHPYSDSSYHWNAPREHGTVTCSRAFFPNKRQAQRAYLVRNNGKKKKRRSWGQIKENKRSSQNGKASETSLLCSLLKEKNNQKILRQSTQDLNHLSLRFSPCFLGCRFCWH